MVAEGRSTKSISPISRDNAANAQHRHPFHFEQQSGNPITTMYTKSTSNRASSHVRDPLPKTIDAFPKHLPIAADTTFIPRDLGAFSSKRKTWEQEDPLAPKDICNSTEDQPSPQIEVVKEAGELPTPKRQKKNGSPPHVVMAQGTHSLKPHTTPPTITVVSDIVSYKAVRIPTATMPFTGGRLSFNDTRLSCVLPQDFDYNFDKIVEATEADGMLKFDVSWEPVFVSFAQIRGEAEAVAELITNLPSLVVPVGVGHSATVPDTATAFSIEAFKGWEIVLRDGSETLLLEVCFPNSKVEFKDLKGVHTVNYAGDLVTNTFGKIKGNQLLRT